ncbi:hypothetical protein C9374_011514 [Naegleria lovaniensis]|uniref:Histidine kinase n=1 Tax=Naegleria lovaniensis TaxID=51637 RepID=A0AA88GY99_NAELO|nr:uncharacterized protein C9374_011514 [Naegleria lovaniensis]KAG2392789.1 hypothetical protein C9374_011514 [Naegleria lovaniensis]
MKSHDLNHDSSSVVAATTENILLSDQSRLATLDDEYQSNEKDTKSSFENNEREEMDFEKHLTEAISEQNNHSSSHQQQDTSSSSSEWKQQPHEESTNNHQTSSQTYDSKASVSSSNPSDSPSYSTTYILYLYEKIHQRFFVPFLFIVVYLYLCIYATDYHFSMAFICLSLMAINLPIFRDALQSTVVDKLIQMLVLKSGATLHFPQPLTEFQTYSKDDATSNHPTHKNGNSNTNTANPTNISTETQETTTNVQNSSDISTRQQTHEKLPQRIYAYKLVILINIVLHFLRLHFANRDPTMAWMCIGFLASTIHNLSSFILHNSIATGEDGLSTALWSILPLNVLSVGTSVILAIQYARYSEAFGVLAMLTIFNLVFNTTSFKLIEKLNVMNIMTSRLREANKSKNALVSSISHEFRSPLMSISGCIELLLDTPLSQDQLNYLKTIGCCSSILLTLIEDILQYSKLEKGSFEVFALHLSGDSSSRHQHDQQHSSAPTQSSNSEQHHSMLTAAASNTIFSLEECLEHVVSIVSTYAQNFSVSIQMSTSSSLPTLVYGESVRLQQILINLLTNAVKASSPNSTVMLKVETRDDHGDSLSESSRNAKQAQWSNESANLIETVVFKVIDHGKGIPKDIQHNLFKPYFSQFLEDGLNSHNNNSNINSGMIAATSTGLGLTIARKIVATNFNGELTFESNAIPPNTGTTFIVTIPFRIPDKKKKNSLKYIEDLLKNQNFPTQILSATTDEHHSNKEIQRSHLLHKELFKIKPTTNASSPTSTPPSPTIATFHQNNNNNTTRISSPTMNNNSPTEITPLSSNPGNDLMDVSQYNILLAEDNPINLSVLKRLLEKGGFKNITTSSNGLELINAFQQKFYHLVITDYHMPEMNGLEAAHIIRGMNHGNDTKIIILTADALLEKHEFMDSIDFSLNKPISSENLNKAVVSALMSTNDISFEENH